MMCSKDWYEYEEGTDKVTGNKEIKQANTEIAMYEDIVFWPRNFSGQLLVDLVTLGSKKFQNKDEPFAPTVRPGKKFEGHVTTLVLQNYGEWRDCYEIMVAVLKYK